MKDLEQAFSLYRQQRFAEAEPLFVKLLKEHPSDFRLALQLGALCVQDGRPQQALDWLTTAQQHAPESDSLVSIWQCHAFAALLLHQQAWDAGRTALAKNADDPSLFHQMGVQGLKLQHAQHAVDYLQRAVELQPANGNAWHDLGIALHFTHHYEDAARAYSEALEQQPDNPVLHYNCCLTLVLVDETESAIRHCEAAIRLKPDYPEAMYRLANLYRQTCDWDAYEKLWPDLHAVLERSLLSQESEPVAPYALNIFDADQSLHDRICQRYSASVAKQIHDEELPANNIVSNNPLRIGYLSADVGPHAVGGLIRDLFSAHSRENVHVALYTLKNSDSDIFKQTVAGADYHLDVSHMSDVQIVTHMREHGLHVLIDLNGYTLNGRPGVLARRAAPIQVSWLGYLNTMMSDFVDYIVVDDICRPDSDYQEKFAVLNCCFLPGSKPEAISPGTRADYGLASDRFVFASFNNSYKITRPQFQGWCEILRQNMDAQLWLYAGGNAATENNLRNALVDEGLTVDRLVFAGRVGMADHFARLHHADLVLDSWRYGGGATGMAAALAGVPSLTMKSEPLLSRMGASLNHFLGVSGLTVTNTAEYVKKAVSLSRQPTRLKDMRNRIDQALAEDVFHPGHAASQLENVFAQMWARYAAGQSPAGIKSTLPNSLD